MNTDKEFDFSTYLISHAEELKQFSKDVNILSSSALTQLQRLPISLRRRAASHKTRRLPFRFRKLAKAVPAKKIQRKCRYYIRRRLNLKAVYLKRQLKIKWLYTHIWHAKRFKIVNKWGWRVPYEPAQKTFRPCTKAMTNGCCVVDISYFCTLELFGKANTIINKLTSVIENGQCKLMKSQIKEGKQVSFTMYRLNKWPYGAIGPCKILRISAGQSVGSSFLLSFHTCCRDEVIQTVSEIFALRDIGSNCWTTDSGKAIVRDRSTEFSRFRLIGSRSQNVVHGLLDDASPFRTVLARPLSEIASGYAFETEIEDLKSKRPALKQTDIVGFVSYARDSVAAVPLRQLDECSRFLTNPDLIAAIKDDNQSSLEQLVKFDLDPIIDGEKCAAMVTRVHYQDGKAAGGWEIVVPAKWSMKMWMALVMKGCRLIGYRYWARYCALEASSLMAKHDCFPIFGWPDTASGVLESESSRDKQSLLWKRRPSAKRINFTRCVTESPFSCPWQRILSDSVDHPFYVIRDINMLFRVVRQIFDGSVKPTVDELNQFLPDAQWALVPVNLESGSTIPSSNAVIMAANLDDDQQVVLKADKSLIRPVIGYLELADQSLAVGQGRGFGFVSLYQAVALCTLYRPLTQFVWFKNTNTTRFVAGKLSLSI